MSDQAVFNKEPVDIAEVASVLTVFAATSRKPTGDSAQMFTEERSKVLSYVELEVGIPKAHRPGRIERATSEPNPAQHFTLVDRRSVPGSSAFRQDINRQLRALPADQQELLIFVHGFNNNFASGVFRQTQMLTDFDVEAVALHYSWPSASRPEGYVYDRDSAIFAQDGLVDVLRLAASTDATYVTLVAHSMGSLVTMQALRTLALSGDTRTLNRLGTVILAAPDVDIDVFDAVLTSLGPNQPDEFVVLVSKNDKALNLSSSLRGGHPRVGQSETADFLLERGIVVLDVSEVDGGSHSTFGGSPALIDMVKSNALEQTLAGAEQEQKTATVVNDASDAASLLILLPSRMLNAVAGAAN
jgi:esterase/lipase superfamily enzyme